MFRQQMGMGGYPMENNGTFQGYDPFGAGGIPGMGNFPGSGMLGMNGFQGGGENFTAEQMMRQPGNFGLNPQRP